MMDGPVIESRHEAEAARENAQAEVLGQPTAKRRRSIWPIVAIALSLILLAVLLVVLLVLTRNTDKKSMNYEKNYVCAVDEYNYYDEVFEVGLSLKGDKTYKLSFSDSQYSIGSFREEKRTFAKSADGASEVNYYLVFHHEKTLLDNTNITEVVGDETPYILNINDNSNMVLLIQEDSNTLYYCKIK